MAATDLPRMVTGMCLPAGLPVGPWRPLRGLGSHRATLARCLPSSSPPARAVAGVPESSRVASMLRSCMSRDCRMSPSPRHRRDTAAMSKPLCPRFLSPSLVQGGRLARESRASLSGAAAKFRPPLLLHRGGAGLCRGALCARKLPGPRPALNSLTLLLHRLPRPPGSQGHPSSERRRWGFWLLVAMARAEPEA